MRWQGLELLNLINLQKMNSEQNVEGLNVSPAITKPMLAADYTGYFDDNGDPIYVGQKLKSQWNYEVIVCKSDNGSFYGKLVCDDNHSCKNIPYALNDGMGYTICG